MERLSYFLFGIIVLSVLALAYFTFIYSNEIPSVEGASAIAQQHETLNQRGNIGSQDTNNTYILLAILFLSITTLISTEE